MGTRRVKSTYSTHVNIRWAIQGTIHLTQCTFTKQILGIVYEREAIFIGSLFTDRFISYDLIHLPYHA